MSSTGTFRRPTEFGPADGPVQIRPTGSFVEVEPLLALCAAGKLYEAEQWIAEGRPLQFPPPDDRKLIRRSTPLQIAIDRGFHSLVGLLLANGYDPNGDSYECLSPAIRARDHDLVGLLLRFGADPAQADFCDALETCDRRIIDQLIGAGVDPCNGNATARALRTKRRPILGFVKQYRDRFPDLQRQVDIALHVFTNDEDMYGISLMLWLDGNPHADVPGTAEPEEIDEGSHESAFERALWARNPAVLTRLLKRPIPPDRVNYLLDRVAHHGRPDLVRRLLELGADANATSEEGSPVLQGFITSILWNYFIRTAEEEKQRVDALELVIKAGGKWSPTDKEVKDLRRSLAGAKSTVAVALVDLLSKHGVFTPEQLHEFTRTPSVRKVLNGFSRPRRDPWDSLRPAAPPVYVPAPEPNPPKRNYWKSHWSRR